MPDRQRLAYSTQTTLSLAETAAIVAVLRRRFPSIDGPRNEDICYATTNRQRAVAAIAPRADAVPGRRARPTRPTRSGWSRSRAAAGCQARSLIADCREHRLGRCSTACDAGASAPARRRRRLLVERVDRRLPRAVRGRRARRCGSPTRTSPSGRRRSRWRAGPPEPVAVYTDVDDGAGGASWPTTSWRRWSPSEAIAEGVENSNFRLRHRARPLHPDHLREAGRRRPTCRSSWR